MRQLKKKILVLAAGLLVVGSLAGVMLYQTEPNEVETLTEWAPVANETLGNKTIEVAKSDTYTLYFVEDTAEVLIKDRKDTILWRSNPEDREEDPLATGINKMNLNAQLIVEYLDSQDRGYVINNYTGSIKDKNFSYELKDEGIYITFQFEAAGLEIPVYYGLKDDFFTAKILCDQIKQHGEFEIASITLLPYFGAGGLDDEGYMVVPDGSGAKINFNNDKHGYLSYSDSVYGRDLAINTISQDTNKMPITMPLFGMKHNDLGYLAVIHEGEYQAEIGAEVSKKKSSNNVIYSTVRFIQKERSNLLENSVNQQESVMLSEQMLSFPSYEVRYYLLDKKSADYSGMAQRYQKYLVEEKGMEKLAEVENQGTKMNIDFIGSVKKQDTFMGIPYETVEPLAPYSEVTGLLKELLEQQSIDMSVRYLGFMDNGLRDKLSTKVTFEDKLGGKRDFKKLLDFTEEKGIGFYPSFNVTDLYESGNGYNGILHAARNISRSPALIHSYFLSTGKKDPSISPSYLVTPKKIPEVVGKVAGIAKKQGIHDIALEGVGNKVYSDFDKKPVTRNEAGEFLEESLASLYTQVDSIMMEAPFAYAMPYTDRVVNTPMTSSGFDVIDEDIPFYQMVMSGYTELYSEPVNMQPNMKEYLLKVAETGVYPSFLFATQNPSGLMNSNYTYLYAIHYEDWKEDVVQIAEKFKILEPVYNEVIVKHEEIQKGIVKTTYANGYEVYINYNQEDISIDGINIPKEDFIITGGH